MKTCPICGAGAFDDAQVCYGCLYHYPNIQQEIKSALAGSASLLADNALPQNSGSVKQTPTTPSDAFPCYVAKSITPERKINPEKIPIPILESSKISESFEGPKILEGPKIPETPKIPEASESFEGQKNLEGPKIPETPQTPKSPKTPEGPKIPNNIVKDTKQKDVFPHQNFESHTFANSQDNKKGWVVRFEFPEYIPLVNCTDENCADENGENVLIYRSSLSKSCVLSTGDVNFSKHCPCAFTIELCPQGYEVKQYLKQPPRGNHVRSGSSHTNSHPS